MRNQRKGNGRQRRAQPPQLESNIMYNHVFRFRSTSGNVIPINDQDFRGIAGAVCSVANTTLNFVARAAKVHRVEIWTPPASQGAAATCSWVWYTPDYVASREVSDTSVSTAIPAHVSTRPPPGSACAFWLGGSGNQVAEVTAPTGSIIDIHVTLVLYDSGAAGTAYTVAAGTLGAFYYLPLDGDNDLLVPVGLTTTT